uniref:VWFA domain-containing protein n=1 Tax=Heterorhabditis bacteriophora TaxID=37862 RepID=A0A1I7X481_HETBA
MMQPFSRQLVQKYIYEIDLGFGPPGMRPPNSFEAEHWYPSNLPTVRPPWSVPRAELEEFKKTKSVTTLTTKVQMTVELSTTLSTPVVTKSITESAISNSTTLSTPNLKVMETSTSPMKSTISEISNVHLEAISSEMHNAIERVEKKELALNNAEDKREKEKVAEDNVFVRTNIFEDTIDASINSQELQLTNADSSTATLLNNVKQTTEISILPINEVISTKALATVVSSTTSFSQVKGGELNEITTLPNTVSLNSQVTSFTGHVQKHVLSASQENVAEQKENVTIRRDCPDIFFMLDSSGNVESQYEKQKNLIKTVLKEIGEAKRRYGLMTYAGRKRQRMNIPLQLDVSQDLFIRKLERARFLGGITATGAAIHEVTSALADVENPTVVVIITDGFSFDDVEDQSAALRALPGISVYVTGDYFPTVRPNASVIVQNVLNDHQKSHSSLLLDKRNTSHFLAVIKFTQELVMACGSYRKIYLTISQLKRSTASRESNCNSVPLLMLANVHFCWAAMLPSERDSFLDWLIHMLSHILNGYLTAFFVLTGIVLNLFSIYIFLRCERSGTPAIQYYLKFHIYPQSIPSKVL